MEINRKNLDILFRVFRLQFAVALENTSADWRNFCGINPSSEDGALLSEPVEECFTGSGNICRRFERTVAIPREDIEQELHSLYSLLIARMGCETGRFLRRLAIECLLSDPVLPDGSAFFHSARVCHGRSLCNTCESEFSGTAFAVALEEMSNYRDGCENTSCISPNLLIVGSANKRRASAVLRELPLLKKSAGNSCEGRLRLLALPELGKQWFLCASGGNVKPVSMRLSSLPELVRANGAGCAYGVSVRGEAFLTFPHLIFRGGAEECMSLRRESGISVVR